MNLMQSGSLIEVKTKEGDLLKGLVMPSTDKNILSLKLDSGYNINLDKKKINKIQTIKQRKTEAKEQNIKLVNNPKLKTITILHTGGTIASKVSYVSGAVSPSFKPEDLVLMFPELKNIANIKSKLIANIFSEDIRLAHYNLIAKEIAKEINSCDGIIITHGTDTLVYTSAALSFILENLNKPILLVGAQRSSDRGSTDAALNLICAAQFIAKTDFNEVAVCMHAKSEDNFCHILPACNAKKLHTSRRDAFKVVNSRPIAKIYKGGDFEFLIDYKKKEHLDKLKLKLFNEKLKIGILKSHPSLFKDEIKMFSKFNGLIIEGTGLGHIGINVIDKNTRENGLILKEIKSLAKKIPLVMTSQCIFGGTNMNVYETGRKLQDIGVLGNFNTMTIEATFIKLAWLLSNYKKDKIKDLITHNFRGELNNRLTYSEEFI